ncbi:MAG: lysozyme family protein [Lachnospiraceae bacterium]|nr:lysozyme family protein [Robinsoniella sp.]MDY3765843.1 lysozyme family protein [Lachnospiraceae bacterium]
MDDWKERRERQIKKRVTMAVIAVALVLTGILVIVLRSGILRREGEIVLTQECESYRSEVEMVAEKYGMTPYVDLIMAVMMQESGGRSLDVMQCAEGVVNTLYPHVPNGITDPSYSIDCGIQELKYALEKVECKNPRDIEKIKIALQGYNFGIDGFLAFLQEKGDVRWTEEYAQEYARQASGEVLRDASDAETMGPWAYGDQYYPLHVLRFYKLSAQ